MNYIFLFFVFLAFQYMQCISITCDDSVCMCNNYKCFCTGRDIKMSTVTERSVPNTSNYVSDIDNNTTQSRKKRNAEKNKKLDNCKTTLPPNSIKESISSDYQSYKNRDSEERPSKILKKDVLSKDQDLHGNIVLWERPGDNAQSILEISAAVSSMTLTWNYSKIEECW